MTTALMMCRGIDVGCLSWLWPPPTQAFLAQFRAAAPRDAMAKENLPNPLQQTTSSGLLVSRETRIETQICNYNHIIPFGSPYTKNSSTGRSCHRADHDARAVDDPAVEVDAAHIDITKLDETIQLQGTCPKASDRSECSVEAMM